jgi:hypothetical protein
MEEHVAKTLFGLSLSDWEKMPQGEWVKHRKPGFIVTRTRVVKFSDGSTQKYFVLKKRPTSKRELMQLEREIKLLQLEVQKTRRSQIICSERRLIKKPTPPKQRGRRRKEQSE